MPKDYRRNNREKFSSGNTLPTEKSGVRHVGKAVTHTRGRSSVKTVEFKRRTHLGIPLARARPPGPASKPLLGKATTNRKYQDPPNRERLRDVIRGEYGVQPFEGNALAAILIARFWFQHNYTNYSFYADELRVYRIMLTICERATLLETKQACHRLRSDYNKMKLLMSITGPGLVTIASVTSDTVPTRWLHRLPVHDIPKAQAGFYNVKLPLISEQEVKRVMSLVLEKGAGRGYATDKELEKLPPQLLSRFEGGKRVGFVPNPAYEEAVERLASEREARVKTAWGSKEATAKSRSRKSSEQINGKQGTFKGNAYVVGEYIELMGDDDPDPEYSRGHTAISSNDLIRYKYPLLQCVKCVRRMLSHREYGRLEAEYDLTLVCDRDDNNHFIVVWKIRLVNPDGSSYRYKGGAQGASLSLTVFEAAWAAVMWFLSDGSDTLRLAKLGRTDVVATRPEYQHVMWRELEEWKAKHIQYQSQLNGANGEHTGSDDVDSCPKVCWEAFTEKASSLMNEVSQSRYLDCRISPQKVFTGIFGQFTCEEEEHDFCDYEQLALEQAKEHALMWTRGMEEDEIEFRSSPLCTRLAAYEEARKLTLAKLQRQWDIEAMERDEKIKSKSRYRPPSPGDEESSDEEPIVTIYHEKEAAVDESAFQSTDSDDEMPALDAPSDSEDDEMPSLLIDSDSDSDAETDVNPYFRGLRRVFGGARGNGAKGNSFVAPSVVNRGQGGKSKRPSPPSTTSQVASHAQAVSARLDAEPPRQQSQRGGGGERRKRKNKKGRDKGRRKKDRDEDSEPDTPNETPEEAAERLEKAEKMLFAAELNRKFIVHRHNNRRTVFKDPNEAGESWFDAGGAPFCGRVAVDTAVGFSTNFEDYMVAVGIDNVYNIPAEIGSDIQVATYAWSKRHNLRLFLEGDPVPRDYINSYTNWVVLKFIPGEEGVGHYVVGYTDKSHDSEFTLLEAPPEVMSSWLTGETILLTPEDRARRILRTCESLYDRIEISTVLSLLSSMAAMSKYLVGPAAIITGPLGATLVTSLSILYGIYRGARVLLENVYVHEKVVMLGKHTASSDDDVRVARQRRDAVEFQDTFTRFRVETSYHIDWLGGSYELYKGADQEYVVSDTLYMSGMTAMENLATRTSYLKPEDAIVEISRDRNVNYPPGCSIILGTAKILSIAARTMAKRMPVGPDPEGLVAWSAPGAAAVIPNVVVAINGQISGEKQVKVAGAGWKYDSNIHNHVLRYSLEAHKTSETEPIGTYPLGPLMSSEGPVGPGFFATTNSVNTLAAFVGRGMTKEKQHSPLMKEFLDSSCEFLDYYIDSVDLSSIPVGTIQERFREFYKKKRSQKWIDQKVGEYDRYLAGEMTPKERKAYLQHGFFIKFEANEKDGLPRPRGIMTMCGLMLMECCEILGIIFAWNHGDFSKYQVKGMTPAETIALIMEHTNGCYSVSDYSAFESSIDMLLRSLEEYVIYRLLDRAGLLRVWEAYLVHAAGNRELKTRWGWFLIGTRCSGDFWTSFGNGIVNVCAMRFCAMKKGLNFTQMLAEGDDGLVPTSIPDTNILRELGLKFSSEQQGTQDGDCDFLRKRIVEGKYYLSIGKVLTSTTFVKEGHLRGRVKQLSILRCMAHSVYHQSPGHPVLSSLVNYIWKRTAGLNPTKKIRAYFQEQYFEVNIEDPGIQRVEVDETMRGAISSGAHGFAPMSVAVQLELERRFEMGVLYVGDLLRGDPDYDSRLTSTIRTSSVKLSVGQLLEYVRKTKATLLLDEDEEKLTASCGQFLTFPTWE